jgi:hypothetical protein
MIRMAAMIFQQIMTELNGAESEDIIVVITKIVLKLIKQMAARVNRPLKSHSIQCKWHCKAVL